MTFRRQYIDNSAYGRANSLGSASAGIPLTEGARRGFDNPLGGRQAYHLETPWVWDKLE